MKRSKALICSSTIAATVAVACFRAAFAADQTYDPASPNGNNWSTATVNWDNSTSAWIPGNNAIFTGTGETVEVEGALTVGNITFNSTGFTIADTNANGSLTLGAPSTITVTNLSDTATISAKIIGGSALFKAGAGTLVLSGVNTYSGTTTVDNGYLKVTSNSALGDTGGTTVVNSTPVVDNAPIAGAVILGNGVTITGETIRLAGSGNNFVGALQVEANGTATWAGTVILDTGARIGAQNGGTLIISGAIQDGTGTGLSIGRETVAGPSGVVIISGTNNTYSGPTQIVRGILKIGATNALPTGTTLNVGNTNGVAEDSTFDLNGFDQTVAVLQRTGTGGTGGSFITNNGAAISTLTINSASASSYNGVIQDGISKVALAKAGSGTLTLSGANTYTGDTTLSGGILSLTGSLSGTNIVVSGTGVLNESSAGVIGGASSVTINAGSSTLGGGNTYTGATVINPTVPGATAELRINHNAALGSTTGTTTVMSNGRLVLGNGLVINETAIINGTGGDNNFGTIQTTAGVIGLPTSATWAGNILIGSSGARLGSQANSTLIVTGVIDDGANSFNLDISASGTGGVVVLAAHNTYGNATGAGSLNRSSIVRGTLRLGINEAIPDGVIVDVHSAATTDAAIFDLNGFNETIAGLLQSNTLGTDSSVVTNSSTTASTLAVGNSAGTNTSFGGVLRDGVGQLALTKIGTSTQSLTSANTYTGATTVNGGILQLNTATGTLASTNIVLNTGGTLALTNTGAASNNNNRLADTADLTFNGGTLLLSGADDTTTSTTERVDELILNSGISKITVTFGGGASATLNATQFTRPALSGIGFVNGVNLGRDGTSTSIGRVLLTNAPTLIGTTNALPTGINSASAHDTKIVPYLLGEVSLATGTGTNTGIANTFVTYDPVTGLRPLSLTDEFTQNLFVANANTRITSSQTASSSIAINSLIVEGASTTITLNGTLTVTSGAIFFSGGSNPTIGGTGTLNFGSTEGIITTTAGTNTTISTLITGTAGITYSGSGLIVLRNSNPYSGGTLLQANAAIGNGGAFGTGTLIFGGGSIRPVSSGTTAVANAIEFRNDTTIATQGALDKDLTFTGNVTLTRGNRTLTNASNATTTFNGAIGDGGNGLGLTFAAAPTGTGKVVLTGNSTYTGATNVKGGIVVVSGSLSGTSAVTVGDAANLTTSAVLGGGGTIGNVTVGAAAGNTGATLQPHAGSASTSAGTTLHTGSATFLDGSAHLSLQIGRTNAFSAGGGTGDARGDVSDHLSAAGSVTLNGADLQLSLLTVPSHGVSLNDVFFLVLNDGTDAITGTFGSINGLATNLNEGSTFAFGGSSYKITYLADFDTNSYTGGNDIALLAVVPEPGALTALLGGLASLLGMRRFRRRELRSLA